MEKRGGGQGRACQRVSCARKRAELGEAVPSRALSEQEEGGNSGVPSEQAGAPVPGKSPPSSSMVFPLQRQKPLPLECRALELMKPAP